MKHNKVPIHAESVVDSCLCAIQANAGATSSSAIVAAEVGTCSLGVEAAATEGFLG
jgi:hypothetical protein